MQYDIIRAWKDEEYRRGLNEEQVTRLPENPAGMMDLSDAELEIVSGAGDSKKVDNKGSVGSVGGANNNSYFCGNYSYTPRTNIGGTSTTPLLSIVTGVLLGTGTTTTTFDFTCSISGINAVCIFPGKE